jgi:3D (Asp-Asp-Asp) domain-containing protein
MRESLKRLGTFAICVVAALSVREVKVTVSSLIPLSEQPVKIDLPVEVASCPSFPRDIDFPLMVKVTAYAAVPRCTKKINPDITASGRKIRRRDHYRLVALSPDLARNFKFGDQFRLKVGGRCYVVEYRDKMPDKHRKSIDFLLPSVKHCNEFGVKIGKLSLIRESKVRVR